MPLEEGDEPLTLLRFGGRSPKAKVGFEQQVTDLLATLPDRPNPVTKHDCSGAPPVRPELATTTKKQTETANV
jgi:hypothetical protein